MSKKLMMNDKKIISGKAIFSHFNQSRNSNGEKAYKSMNMIKAMNKTIKSIFHRNLLMTLAFFTVIVFGGVSGAFAQYENTKGKADQNLRSNARINPSTLAMELAIPIADMPGRGGASMPLVLNYSSKVWRLQATATNIGYNSNETEVRPVYSEEAMAGWTSSYYIPKIDTVVEPYDCKGNAMGDGSVMPTGCGSYQYVKRIRITLPDGSSHELRKDDLVHATSNTTMDKTGTFYAVDGTRVRLEWGSQGESTLYLPDGGRYFFDSSLNCYKYIDRNGNALDYNSSTGAWTDTMGRSLASPIPFTRTQRQNQAEGTQTFTVPGLGSTTRQYQLVWKKLSSGALITGGSLEYDANSCTSGSRSPVLFNNALRLLACTGSTGYFDPVVLSEIVLPNGQKYTFQYNSYGEIARIDYPTGAYEKFTHAQITGTGWDYQKDYNSSNFYGQANRGVVDRYVGATDITPEQRWQYSTGFVSTAYDQYTYQVTTTAPDGSVSKRYLHRTKMPTNSEYGNFGFDTVLAGMEMESQTLDTNGQLRSRKLLEWEVTQGAPVGSLNTIPERDARVKREVTVVFEPGSGQALATMSVNTYDDNADQRAFAKLNLKRTEGYSFVVLDAAQAQTMTRDTIVAQFTSGHLLKASEIDYLYDANYLARGLISLPIEQRVLSANNTLAAKSQIVYDEGAYPLITIGSATGWEDPQTSVRGNPTTSRAWDSSTNTFIETHAQFDQFGNLRKAWDAKGNLSETEYSSTYNYAYPTKVKTPAPDPTGQNGSSVSFETTMTYDLTTGLPLTTTDANGQTAQMEYNDSLLRPTRVVPPAGGAVQETIYNDTPGSIWVKTRSQIDGTNWSEAIAYMDGLGRTKATQKKDAQGDVFTEVLYDNMGRAKQVTNPFRANETKVWTVTNYDEAGRAKETITPDGAMVQTGYTLTTSGSHLGTSVIVTDQAGKVRRSVTNALGQLVRVDEPDANGNLGAVSSPVQPTVYAYDTLSNLTQVYQGVQTRTFAYDSLSRLRQAVNPESGTISYNYDANGNLTTKTDARSVTTTYVYDNLNRALTRSYSDGTPQVAYKYDDGSVQYSKGKLTRVSSSVSETRYTQFSNLGNVLATQQVTDNVTFNFGYTYNLAGMPVSETYPSGRVVSNQFQTDGNLAQVNGLMNGVGKTYAANISYTSAGAISSMLLGNGRWESAGFNARLQPVQLALGTTQNGVDMWKVNYDYGTTQNNGNLLSQTITVPSLNPIVQNYTYDSLNRIKSAAETSNNQPSWQQVFNYDRYGNRNFDAGNTTTLGNCPANQCNPTIDTANNRFTTNQGYTYDLAGNVITDAQSRTFYYDGENKQKEVRDGSNNIIGQYFYDGDGKRVKKLSDSEATIFVYDGAGKLAVEYTVTTQTPQNNNTSYLTTDHLGSPRVITDQTGNVTSRKDFLPFGEEILNLSGRSQSTGYQSDSVRQKFTSYERDNESGLDYAKNRYHNFNLGRFTSPDPYKIVAEVQLEKDVEKAKAKLNKYISQSQQWNQYVYVINNPLKYTDPTGEIILLRGKTEETRKAELERIKNIVGEKAFKYLSVSTDTRFVALSEVNLHGFMVALNDKQSERDIGKIMGKVISSSEVVYFNIADSVTYNPKGGPNKGTVVTEDLCKSHGCAVTVPKDESLSGNIEIYVEKGAGVKASRFSVGSPTRGDDRKILRFVDDSIVDGHEFGHAYDEMTGQKGNWRVIENGLRDRFEDKQRRTDH